MEIPDYLGDKSVRVRLLSSEKDAIKARILDAVAAPKKKLRPSVPSPFLTYQLFMRVASLTLVLFIVAGTSITYATQKSGPGDPLYHFELDVVEPLQESLQNTPKKKAAYHTERLEERLSELQHADLANEDPETIFTLTSEATRHANEANIAFSSELEHAKKVEGLEKVNALVEAHEDILDEEALEDSELKEAERTITRNLENSNDDYVDRESEGIVRQIIDAKLLEAQNAAGVAHQDEYTRTVIEDKIGDAVDEVDDNDLQSALDIISEVRVELLKNRYLNNEEGDDASSIEN